MTTSPPGPIVRTSPWPPPERSAGAPPDALLRLWRLALESRGILQRLGCDDARLRRNGVSVAAAAAAADTDLLFPAEADPAILLARGWSADEIFRMALGRRAAGVAEGEPFPAGGALAGACDPARGVFAPGSLPAAGLPVAAGALLATRRRASPVAAVALIGSGGTASGDFHEGMNFAAVRGLPLLAIVVADETAEAGGAEAARAVRSREAAIERLSDRAEAYGIPGETVGGEDLPAVREAVAAAVWRARAGAGAAILEVLLPAEVNDTTGESAVGRCRSRLVSERHASEADLAAMERSLSSALDEALQRAGEAPEAAEDQLLRGVTARGDTDRAPSTGSADA